MNICNIQIDQKLYFIAFFSLARTNILELAKKCISLFFPLTISST